MEDIIIIRLPDPDGKAFRKIIDAISAAGHNHNKILYIMLNYQKLQTNSMLRLSIKS